MINESICTISILIWSVDSRGFHTKALFILSTWCATPAKTITVWFSKFNLFLRVTETSWTSWYTNSILLSLTFIRDDTGVLTLHQIGKQYSLHLPYCDCHFSLGNLYSEYCFHNNRYFKLKWSRKFYVQNNTDNKTKMYLVFLSH